MKKYCLLSIIVISLLFISACGNKKTVVCTMNSTGSILPKIVVTLDSNDKVSEIEIHTVYENEEDAKKSISSFKSIHGENAYLDKNEIIVKNVHDSSTFFGKQYSKTVGYTVEEFQAFLGNYTCK